MLAELSGRTSLERLSPNNDMQRSLQSRAIAAFTEGAGAGSGALIGGVLGGASAVSPSPKEVKDAMAGAFDKFRSGQPVVVKQPPVTLNLNIDGRTLARALSEAGNPYEGFVTQAPAADGLGQARSGGDQHTPN